MPLRDITVLIFPHLQKPKTADPGNSNKQAYQAALHSNPHPHPYHACRRQSSPEAGLVDIALVLGGHNNLAAVVVRRDFHIDHIQGLAADPMVPAVAIGLADRDQRRSAVPAEVTEGNSAVDLLGGCICWTDPFVEK